MKLSAPERLRRFHAQFSGGDRVLLLINADPDAMAGALAVRRLLWRRVAATVIAHVNVIKRPDNLSMIRLLDIPLTPAQDVDPEQFQKTVVVDSQPDHGDAFARFRADAIIDHHPRGRAAEVPFADIRPEYGATSTILTEYIRAAKIKPSVKLATALILGIKTDTRNFERHAGIEDVKAFQFLFKYANATLIRKIEQADLRLDFLKYFRLGIETMRIRRNRGFVHLGRVLNPDVCVLVADFFMRVNPITWSVVSGMCDDTLVIVFRNDGIRKNAGLVAKKSFGQLGSAGGHASMARAEIPLSALKDRVDLTDDRAVLLWIMNRIEHKTDPPTDRPPPRDEPGTRTPTAS